MHARHQHPDPHDHRGRAGGNSPVGGGITYQSVPELEYDETWHKAEGMLRALR